MWLSRGKREATCPMPQPSRAVIHLGFTKERAKALASEAGLCDSVAVVEPAD
jgi:hypothetical protein